MLYDHVAVIAPGMSLERRAALVATARSRGESTSVDQELRKARQRLEAIETSVPRLDNARRRVAKAEAGLEAKRERVATLRGRMQTTDDGAVAAEYREAVRELSEAETAYIAAKEALDDARREARHVRDERERRLRLQDRIGNLERTARKELIAAVRPAVTTAVPAVPGSDAERFEEADPVTAALALVRVGNVRVPITLACRRFSDARQAEEWLETPVLRL